VRNIITNHNTPQTKRQSPIKTIFSVITGKTFDAISPKAAAERAGIAGRSIHLKGINGILVVFTTHHRLIPQDNKDPASIPMI
jgi:hypothetical protein